MRALEVEEMGGQRSGLALVTRRAATAARRPSRWRMSCERARCHGGLELRAVEGGGSATLSIIQIWKAGNADSGVGWKGR
ncbi:unnamed protein product [Urochloa humidicola]